jgi:tripartite-type tricarboxylate transporter receptor subunit TctC
MPDQSKISRRRSLAALSLPFLGSAQAQSSGWPSRPIKLIVPTAAGSPPDTLARVYAELLRSQFNQAILVDNKPGANQTIGIAALLSSEADGHTFLMTSTEVVRVPQLYPSAKYDVFKDLVPLAHVAQVAITMCVPASLGVSTVQEFVELAKKSPKPLSFGSPGQWSATHFYAMQFGQQAGIELNHVPYRGEPMMLPDLFTEQLAAGFFASPQMPQFAKEGKVKMLAVAGVARRASAYPHLPTFHELGYKDMDIPGFIGFFAAKGTPAAAAERVSAELSKITMRPEIRSRVEAFGWEPSTLSGRTAFTEVVRTAHDRWQKMIRQANVKTE